MMKSERLSDFLEQLGLTVEGQLIFSEKFLNTPVETLCPVLKNVKPLVVQPNIKGILFYFLEAAKARVVNQALEKPVNADSNVLLIYSEVLKAARALFENKNNNLLPHFFSRLRSIYLSV